MVRIVLYRPAISQSDCRKVGPYQMQYNKCQYLTANVSHISHSLVFTLEAFISRTHFLPVSLTDKTKMNEITLKIKICFKTRDTYVNEQPEEYFLKGKNFIAVLDLYSSSLTDTSHSHFFGKSRILSTPKTASV